MPYICHFQDFLAGLSRSEKTTMLQEVGADVVQLPEGQEKEDLGGQTIEDVGGYREMVRDLRSMFGREAATALYSFLGLDGDFTWAVQMSGASREFLSFAREVLSPLRGNVPVWGTHPGNWYLVESDQPAFLLQSRISAQFPCLVFEDGPLEASGSVGDVDLTGVEEVLHSAGVYHLWSRGNHGQMGSVIVLDTGYEPLGPQDDVALDSVSRLTPVDEDGHGTAMIRLIRAISPAVPIRSLRVMSSYSSGHIWDLMAGLSQLHGESQQVITMALGVPPGWMSGLGPSAASFRETITNVISSLGGATNLPICAAGNDGIAQLRWPAAAPQALAVGSHNAALKRSSFSNFAEPGSNFILSAGGDRRHHDDRVESLGRYGPGHTRDIVGTSFSTAVASGLVSLLQTYEWFREMNVDSRISLLRNHCRPNGEGFAILNAADIGAVWPL